MTTKCFKFVIIRGFDPRTIRVLVLRITTRPTLFLEECNTYLCPKARQIVT